MWILSQKLEILFIFVIILSILRWSFSNLLSINKPRTVNSDSQLKPALKTSILKSWLSGAATGITVVFDWFSSSPLKRKNSLKIILIVLRFSADAFINSDMSSAYPLVSRVSSPVVDRGSSMTICSKVWSNFSRISRNSRQKIKIVAELLSPWPFPERKLNNSVKPSSYFQITKQGVTELFAIFSYIFSYYIELLISYSNLWSHRKSYLNLCNI